MVHKSLRNLATVLNFAVYFLIRCVKAFGEFPESIFYVAYGIELK